MKNTALIIGDARFDVQHNVVHNADPYGSAFATHTVSVKRQLGGVGRIAEIIQSANFNVKLLTIVGDDPLSQEYATAVRNVAPTTYIEPQPGYTLPLITYTCAGDSLLSRNDSRSAVLPGRDTHQLLSAIYQLTAEQLAEIGVVVLYDHGDGVCSSDVLIAVRELSALYQVPAIIATNTLFMTVSLDVCIMTETTARRCTSHVVHPGLAGGFDATTQRGVLTKLVSDISLCKQTYVLNDDHSVGYAAMYDNNAVAELRTDVVLQAASRIDSRTEDAAAIAAIDTLSGSTLIDTGIQNYLKYARTAEVGSYLPHDTFMQRVHDDGDWPVKLKDFNGMMAYVQRARRLRETDRIVLVIGLFDQIDHTDIELLRIAKHHGEHVIVAYRRHPDGVVNDTLVPDSFRATQLAMLPMTSVVCGYTGEYEQLVKQLRPDVLVDADSAPGMKIPGDDFVEQRGGLVITKPITFYG